MPCAYFNCSDSFDMSDFFESARSSGVVGISLTIVLIFGFGVLFLAVFDDRFNGENASRLRSLINEQESDLYILEDEIEWAESKLEAQERVGDVMGDLDEMSKTLAVFTKKEGALKKQIEDEKKAISQIEEDQVAYREKYRVFARKMPLERLSKSSPWPAVRY